MKPLGPIPPEFTAAEGELLLGGERVSEVVAEAGQTPLFVYCADIIRQRVRALRDAMPSNLKINYAIKANPFNPILEIMDELIDGFDIASVGELDKILDAAIDCEKVSFAGPGKRDAEIETSLRHHVTLNCESAGELKRILAIGERLGMTPRIAIRVNPDFEIKGSGMKMGGGPKPFGTDARQVPELAKRVIAAGAEWRGLHIFTGSQALSAEALVETQSKTLALAAQLSDRIGVSLPKLNMGGGFGIPYFSGDSALDLAVIGEALKDEFRRLPSALIDTDFCIELGRFLVGESGVYLTRIVDSKRSYGETFLITDGGLHHQLAASGNFGTVVRRNYPAAIATRFDEEPTEVVNIVGCLCTPLDRLATAVRFPKAEIDDLVAIFCAGAYGATASPADFLGQGKAKEILIG